MVTERGNGEEGDGVAVVAQEQGGVGLAGIFAPTIVPFEGGGAGNLLPLHSVRKGEHLYVVCVFGREGARVYKNVCVCVSMCVLCFCQGGCVVHAWMRT